MSARPTYSDEFKADAVALVISSGRSPASVAPELGISVTVACQEDGTAVARFLPPSWDHLFSQSWDRPACCAGESFVSLFDHCVSVLNVEVSRGGFQGGQRG